VLVTQARTSGGGGQARSVVGSIDIDPADPHLLEADTLVRRAFGRSFGRPLVVREAKSPYRPKRNRRG
jgi:hypothetical protein